RLLDLVPERDACRNAIGPHLVGERRVHDDDRPIDDGLVKLQQPGEHRPAIYRYQHFGEGAAETGPEAGRWNYQQPPGTTWTRQDSLSALQSQRPAGLAGSGARAVARVLEGGRAPALRATAVLRGRSCASPAPAKSGKTEPE